MDATILTVDVYCDSLIGHNAYRIYVDDELLTERTWVWPSYEVYIKENIEVKVYPGRHVVRLVNCGPTTNFKFKNLTMDEKLIKKNTENASEVSFIV